MLYLIIRFRKQFAIVFALLLLAGVFYWKGFKRGRGVTPVMWPSSSTAQKPAAVLKPLAPNERERISISLPRNQVTVQTENSVKTVTGVRNATISVEKTGNVSVSSPAYGFTLEPGVNGLVGPNGVYVGVDACVFYFHRLDVLTGFGINGRSKSSALGYVAVGTNVPYLHNTDIFAGLSTQSSFVIGLRVAL